MHGDDDMNAKETTKKLNALEISNKHFSEAYLESKLLHYFHDACKVHDKIHNIIQRYNGFIDNLQAMIILCEEYMLIDESDIEPRLEKLFEK